MAITLPIGQLKNQQPGPTTAAALPLAQQQTGWTNDKGNGDPYALSDLLEDITKPIEAKIDPTDVGWDGQAWNHLLETLSKGIKDRSLFSKINQNWIDIWQQIFEKNPTVNLSEKISSFIERNICDNQTKDDAKKSKSSPDSFLINKIETKFTQFMNNLLKTTPKLLDDNNLNDMQKQLDDTLTILHLDKTDAGVSSFLNLKNDALNEVSQTLDRQLPIKTERPYKVWDSKSANNILVSTFKGFIHNQNNIDVLTNIALNKASNEVNQIVSKISGAPQIDSRTAEVIKELFQKHKQIPSEIYKLFFKNQEQAFLDWENDWQDLFEITPKIEIDPTDSNKFSFKIDINTKNIEIVPKENQLPKIMSNPNQSSNLDLDLSIEEVAIIDYRYSTDLLKEEYINLANLISSPLSEKHYNNWIQTVQSKLIGTKFKGKLTGITVSELEALDSNVFGKTSGSLSGIIMDIKNQIKHSRLKITFEIDIKDNTLTLKPTIEDSAILSLPTINWTSHSTSIVDQQYIDGLFRTLDNPHEKITLAPEMIFDEKIESILSTFSKTLYDIFDTPDLQSAKPFRKELIKNKVGGEISLDDLRLFINKQANAQIDALFSQYVTPYVNNPKKGISVDFSIESINDDGMVIEYTITNKESGKVTKYLIGDSTQQIIKKGAENIGAPLDNIYIEFNKGIDIAKYYLQQLGNSKIVPPTQHSNDDKKSSVDATKIQLKNIFPELDDITKDAKNIDGVVLEPLDGLIKIQTKNGLKIYQKFKATYTAWSGKTFSHILKIKVSGDKKRKGIFKVEKSWDKPKHHPALEDKKAWDITKHKEQKENTTDEKTNPQKQKGIFKVLHPWNKPKHHKSHALKKAQWEHDHLKQKDDATLNNMALAAAAAAAMTAIDNANLDPDAAASVKEKMQGVIADLQQKLQQPNLSDEDKKKIQDEIDNIPKETTRQILDNIQGDLEDKLKKEFPDETVPKDIQDALKEIMKKTGLELGDLGDLEDPSKLAEALKLLGKLKNMDVSKLLDTKKIMSQSTKLTLVALGGLLGVGSVIGAANAGKIASTNRRIKAASGSRGKIKSSKKLAFMSLMFGMISLAGSVGTFVYIFVSQGGL